MNKLLSVIVPVYNVELYLPQCIESILASTYRELEVILVDDGSRDSSYKICNEYVSRDNRVRCYHFDQPGGAVRSRQKGIELSTADYVTYVDSDDWIEPQAFEKMMQAIIENQADMVISTGRYHEFDDVQIINKDNVSEGIYTGEKIDVLCEKMLNDSEVWATLWNKIFKKDKHERCQRKLNTLIRVNEDATCTIMTALNVDKIVVLDGVFYHYRRNKDSLTHIYKTENVESHCFLYQCISKEIIENKKLYLLNNLKVYFLQKLFMDIRIEYSRMIQTSVIKKLKRIHGLYLNPIIIDFINDKNEFELKGRELVIWKLFRKKRVVLLYVYLKYDAVKNLILSKRKNR